MLQVLAQDDLEVAWSGDQKVVEAFPLQGADEPFRDRVRPGRSDRGADDPQVGAGEDGVEGGGELAVSVADQEPELLAAIAEVHHEANYQRERRQLAARRKAAFAVDPTGANQVWQLDFTEFETTTGGTWRLAGCRGAYS